MGKAEGNWGRSTGYYGKTVDFSAILAILKEEDLPGMKGEDAEMEETSLIPPVRKKLSDVVEDALAGYIDAQLKAGNTKLPPELELAQTLAVSRTTIRRALSTLENKGVILRLHGKGTFINPNLNQVKLNFASGQPLLQLIEGCGFSPDVSLLYHLTGEASPLQQSALQLEEQAPIMTICKVFYADRIPVVLVVDDVPCRYLEEHYGEEELRESTFDLIRRSSGILCVRDEMQIATADSGAILAYSMGKTTLTCTSALMLDVVNYSEQNVPVFLSKQFFNTSYIKFHMVRTLDVYR